MSQGSVTIADGSGAAVLAAINASNARFSTMASGTARPSDIGAGELWRETDNPGGGIHSIWLYDGASDVLVGLLDTTTHTFAPSSASFDSLLGSTKGMLAKRGASSWAGLAVGSAFHGLMVNSAGDDLEFRRNGYEKIADDAVPAGAANVTFSSIPANVRHLRIEFSLKPATNGVNLQFNLAVGGGIVTSANYANMFGSIASNGGVIDAGAAGQTTVPLNSGTYPVPNTSRYKGAIEIVDLQDGANPRCGWWGAYGPDTASSFYWSLHGAATLVVAGPVDGFRFQFSSGNITDGYVSAFGVRA